MNPDIQEHLQIADEALRESKHLFAGGFYRGALGRAYYVMFRAAVGSRYRRNSKRKDQS